MKINVNFFEYSRGVKFTINPEDDAERALLHACVDEDVLEHEEDDNFLLTLAVSN